jgi:mannose-6-phosphate isomerase-like protein (cupin superfamily)
MSAGIYTLPTGSQDPQKPHNEDELYYVLNGTAVIEVGEEEKVVSPGSAVFVPAHTQHKFSAVKEELKVLVIFSPPEDSSS